MNARSAALPLNVVVAGSTTAAGRAVVEGRIWKRHRPAGWLLSRLSPLMVVERGQEPLHGAAKVPVGGQPLKLGA
jgi:hypothetical protein